MMPDEPQAHSEHAAALAALSMYDDAQVAYARALALNPLEVDALLGAAHLYAVSLPSSRQRDELAAVYAEKGLSLPQVRANKHLRAQFALISAMALNDLGQAKDALERANLVLQLEPSETEASYERAVALFELCHSPRCSATRSTGRTPTITWACSSSESTAARPRSGILPWLESWRPTSSGRRSCFPRKNSAPRSPGPSTSFRLTCSEISEAFRSRWKICRAPPT